ncbi:MAG: hypothetical protein ACYTX0_60415 [Nostoc sp.]
MKIQEEFGVGVGIGNWELGIENWKCKKEVPYFFCGASFVTPNLKNMDV